MLSLHNLFTALDGKSDLATDAVEKGLFFFCVLFQLDHFHDLFQHVTRTVVRGQHGGKSGGEWIGVS